MENAKLDLYRLINKGGGGIYPLYSMIGGNTLTEKEYITTIEDLYTIIDSDIAEARDNNSKLVAEYKADTINKDEFLKATTINDIAIDTLLNIRYNRYK